MIDKHVQQIKELFQLLSFNVRDFAYFRDPGLGRAKPNLACRDQLISLLHGGNSKAEPFGSLAIRSGVNVGAAVGAEYLLAMMTAIGGLDIDFWMTG